MQSHLGEIHLLPALPDAWPEGDIRGIRARGGFGLDIYWADGKLTKALIRSDKGGVCKVRLAAPATVTNQGAPVTTRSEEGNVIAFETRNGQEYLIVPK